MDKIEKKQYNYLLYNRVGTFCSVVIIFFAIILQDVSFFYKFSILRLMLHAIAAIGGTVVFYFTVVRFMVYVTQTLLEEWILIVYKKRKKRIIELRNIIKVLKPIVSAAMYIFFAVRWECTQAEEFGRGLQWNQLCVDILFALITGYMFYYLSNYTAVYIERYDKEYIEDLNDFYDELIEEHEKTGDTLNVIYRKAMPVIVIAINILIVVLTFVFVHH